jgi:hypothetical protein
VFAPHETGTLSFVLPSFFASVEHRGINTTIPVLLTPTPL